MIIMYIFKAVHVHILSG